MIFQEMVIWAGKRKLPDFRIKKAKRRFQNADLKLRDIK